MRFDIRSKDRIGITQEILAVFSQQNWNLATVEMHLHHTFVELDDNATLGELKKRLHKIEGITEIVEVDLLPGERRSQHLDAVLSKLQDPILDIDIEGRILLANTAAAALLKMDKASLQGVSLAEFIDRPLSSILSNTAKTLDINVGGHAFIVDITPVFSYNQSETQVSGAVLLLQSLRRIGQQISAVSHTPSDSITSLIGSSEATQTLIKNTQRFSRLDMPVLIQGETGTGKELLAHMLHEKGTREDAPFMAINCAALPENLLESELFGYAPGAFSGANKNGKPGLFEIADGGSVFLDEIGEMSAYLQAKLLRFLQEYSFRRIGGEKEISVNVRIISATHRDLLSMADDNTFREDLFYRLNVLNLQVPPLRNRRADIPALSKHFIMRAAEQTNRTPPHICESGLDLLMTYHWPGNIRELQNVLFRAVAMSDDDMLEAHDILVDSKPEQHSDNGSQSAFGSWEAAQENFEKSLLSELYPQYPSSRKLAQRLQVSHNTIALKLKKYGIKPA
ncbi:MAG: sigma 54-interacting transcriptional regulator [Pseudomonadales bacterium]